MASFTTQRSGRWSDTNISGGSPTSPWLGLTGSGVGGVPGVGDTVTVGFGHTLQVDTNQSLGTTSANYDLTIGSNGKAISALQINSGATLTLYGKVLSSGDLVMQPGSNIQFNGTGPFRWHSYNDASTRKGDITVSGTAASRCSIKGTSTGRIYFTNAAGFRNINIVCCDYQYGDATGNFVVINGDELSVSLSNCSFDNGIIPFNCTGVMTSSLNLSISGCAFTNNTSSQVVQIRSGSTATGTRLIYGNSFDRGIGSNAGGWLNFTIDSNVFNAAVSAGTTNSPITTSALGNWTVFQNNLVRMPSVTSVVLQQGPIVNNLFITDHSSGADPNCVQVLQTYSGSGNLGAFQGNVYQSYNLDNNAAFYYLGTGFAATSSTSISCLNNLLLANINGSGGSGSVFNCTGLNSPASVIVEHNTVNVGGTTYPGAILLGDQNAVVGSGTVTSIRGNLCYGTSAPTGNYNGLLRYYSNSVAIDTCPPANCGYNGGKYLHASTSTWPRTTNPGYLQTGAGQFMFSSPPAADTTDVSGTGATPDPQFFDSSRDVVSAYTTLFGNTSLATRALNFQAFTGYASSQIRTNPTLISSAVSWIKSGYAPKNALYNVTFPGDLNAVQNIGAVSGIFGGPAPYFIDSNEMTAFSNMGF